MNYYKWMMMFKRNKKKKRGRKPKNILNQKSTVPKNSPYWSRSERDPNAKRDSRSRLRRPHRDSGSRCVKRRGNRTKGKLKGPTRIERQTVANEGRWLNPEGTSLHSIASEVALEPSVDGAFSDGGMIGSLLRGKLSAKSLQQRN